MAGVAVRNALSVDVEDYFQVSAFEGVIPRSEWADRSLRVVNNTYRLVELFEQHGVKATFFTLGWVAERSPRLVRDIVDAGHELASHGRQRFLSIVPPRGRYRYWRKPGIFIVPACTRSSTTCMGRSVKIVSRIMSSNPGCWRFRFRPFACAAETYPAGEVDIFVCTPMGSRVGVFDESTNARRVPGCFICIRGKSISNNRG